MAGENKAHTATANRIAKRYGGVYNDGDGIDIQTDELTVEVETTATVRDGIKRLMKIPGPVYVAVTNKEGLLEALRYAHDSRVGVMDPKGNVVKESTGGDDPPS